jgi:hypothetical protein
MLVISTYLSGGKSIHKNKLKNIIYILVIFLLIVIGMLIGSFYEKKDSRCQTISNSYNVHPADISNIANNDPIMFEWTDLGCTTVPDKMTCKEIANAYNITQKQQGEKYYLDYGWGTFLPALRKSWDAKCANYFTQSK